MQARAKVIALMMSFLFNTVCAEQQASEQPPDAALLEFLAQFAEKDADYIDEMLDEQQATDTTQRSTGTQHEK